MMKQTGILRLMALMFVIGNSQLMGANLHSRVVCFGDSITKRGYNELLGPMVGAEAINAGVGGHNTKQGLHRMQKDVLDHKPEVVIILFGTNDVRVDSERAFVPLERFEKNLEEMVQRCQKVGAKVVLCTLPPINEKKYFTRHKLEDFIDHGGLKKLLADYRGATIRVAKMNKLPLVDLNQVLEKHPKWLSPDGVHPSKEGTRIIAKLVSEKVKLLLPEKKSP